MYGWYEKINAGCFLNGAAFPVIEAETEARNEGM